jgi:SAM-dependent methyltransferase
MAPGGFTVDYDHRLLADRHSVEGARATLRALFGGSMPKSLLDVGCGTGTWLEAALDLGARDVLGVDGAALPDDLLRVPGNHFCSADLGRPLSLGRRFELVLCLEVAEHLDAASAATLVDSLTAHGDRILFSAAAPGQAGMHHVNCQWPEYWQRLFNARGYACSDAVRWQIWDNADIEPWYRQNLMLAVRDPANAGQEPRIRRVLHPEVTRMTADDFLEDNVRSIERGRLSWQWYLTSPLRAAVAKIGRRLQAK